MTIARHRNATAEDRAFIVSAWSSSFKTSHSAGLIHTDDWAGVMHPQIEKLLERPGSRAVVAFERTDPNFIYGFIAGDTSDRMPVVHFVYTKENYRREGIARGLFAALGVDPSRPFIYTCRTAVVTKLTSKIPAARWNPLVARWPKEQR